MTMKELTKAADEISRCLEHMLRELEIREFVYALDVGALPAEVFRLFF